MITVHIGKIKPVFVMLFSPFSMVYNRGAVGELSLSRAPMHYLSSAVSRVMIAVVKLMIITTLPTSSRWSVFLSAEP